MDFIITAIIQGIGFSALGLGIFLSLRIFNIPDITTDGSYTLGGAVTAMLITSGMNPFTTLIAVVISGMLAGATTGWILTKFKIHPLLAGILVMTALYSVNLMVMGRSNIPLVSINDIYTCFESSGRNTSVAIVLLMMVILLIIKVYYLLKTDFGIAMRATGNSETMVRSMGVNTANLKIAGLSIANGLTALSGYLMTQYQGFADINMGIGIVVSGLGSVMIGEAVLNRWMQKGILVHLLAVIVGSVLFRMIIAAALSFGLNPNYLKLITALIVLIIVAFSTRNELLQQ